MIAVALILTVGLGILIGLVLLGLGLVRGLGTRPDLIEPAAHRDEREKARPIRAGGFRPDKAWPFYPFRQAWADLAKVWAEISVCYRAMWKRPTRAFYSTRGGSPVGWWIIFPVPVVITICLLVAGLASVAFYSLFALVSLACLAVTTAVTGPVTMVLLGLENGRRARLRTQASCPRCFHVTPWPAYRCPHCSILQRDVRPGRLGLIMRRCECGTMLPTMPLRAAWQLKAACQRCRKPLPPGTGAVRDVRISVFGDPAVGKTRFVHAALDSLMVAAERAGIAFGFPDQSSQEQVELGLGRLKAGQDTARTAGTALSAALTFRLGIGRRSTLVHLFDTAGRHFRDPQMHDSLGFLGHSHGLVYLIDPYSIGPVREHLAGRGGRHGSGAAPDPEAAYGEVVERLRDSGVAARGQRLAVVVSKADLLQSAGLDLPADSDLIAEWLMKSGAHNLVFSARREFAEARFFVVASQSGGEARADDPGAPLRWLLRSYGVRLPAETSSGRRRVSQRLGETTGARS